MLVPQASQSLTMAGNCEKLPGNSYSSETKWPKKYFVTVSNGNITQNVQRDSTKIVYASNHMKKIDVKL